ncbi:MAG: hypothetical protein K0S81_2013 [Rhodospirillales bacterium]|jgi:hypothetical protein|nr:hypothetical protein [Rhodospirillales bacterium]
MPSDARGRPSTVIGPSGEPLTIADLPPPETKRWVIRRKAEVVAAVRGGLLTLEEACERYSLSSEEFTSWQRLIDRHGVRGLRTTRLQEYRANGTGGSSGAKGGGVVPFPVVRLNTGG